MTLFKLQNATRPLSDTWGWHCDADIVRIALALTGKFECVMSQGRWHLSGRWELVPVPDGSGLLAGVRIFHPHLTAEELSGLALGISYAAKLELVK